MGNMIETKEYGTRKTILIAPELQFTIPVIVSDEGVTAENGRKIVKAGTPVDGVAVFNNRQTPVTVADSYSSTSAGLILHDVDVTNGSNNGTLLVSGYVDYNKLDATVQAKLDSYLATNDNRVLVMKGI